MACALKTALVIVQMMEAVEDGKVTAVVLKDITRLGGDYLRVGMCMEIMGFLIN